MLLIIDLAGNELERVEDKRLSPEHDAAYAVRENNQLELVSVSEPTKQGDSQ